MALLRNKKTLGTTLPTRQRYPMNFAGVLLPPNPLLPPPGTRFTLGASNARLPGR